MPALDAFNGDTFNTVSMTAAINKLPYQPKMLGQMGLFEAKPISTTQVIIEDRQGKLSVLGTAARGTMPNVDSGAKRTAVSLVVPHIPHNATLLADDVQNVRAFGSETELETLSSAVNDKLSELRADHETTFEWHRLGAIKGLILDADGSTLFDLFTIFGQTETTVDFDLATATTNVRGKCTDVIRAIEVALGADAYTSVVGMCGDSFWDSLIDHTTVREAFANWSTNSQMRNQLLRQTFSYGGIDFINYRGNIGGSPWIATDECRFFCRGVSQLFSHSMAPADFVETVNTRGQMIYAKQERMKFDKGVELHTQSNPLIICTRPASLIKGTE